MNTLKEQQARAREDFEKKFYDSSNGHGIRSIDTIGSHYVKMHELEAFLDSQIEEAWNAGYSDGYRAVLNAAIKGLTG